MRRETDPDFYCPQAALISEETVRRTEARLAKYRQQIQQHHRLLEDRERMLRNRQLVGQSVLIAAAAVVAVGALWVWRRRSSGDSRSGVASNFDSSDFDSDYDEEKLQQDFEDAAKTARAFPDEYLDTRDQLMLYGLYKQAMVGDRTGDAVSLHSSCDYHVM